MNFTISLTNGTTTDLYEILKKKRVIISFYRGHWCPVGMESLMTFQEHEELLEEEKTEVIFITNDSELGIHTARLKTNCHYPIVRDVDSEIINAFGVGYIPCWVERIGIYHLLGATPSGKDSVLPSAATFIINQEAKITWRHFDLEQKNRAPLGEILTELLREEYSVV